MGEDLLKKPANPVFSLKTCFFFCFIECFVVVFSNLYSSTKKVKKACCCTVPSDASQLTLEGREERGKREGGREPDQYGRRRGDGSEKTSRPGTAAGHARRPRNAWRPNRNHQRWRPPQNSFNPCHPTHTVL